MSFFFFQKLRWGVFTTAVVGAGSSCALTKRTPQKFSWTPARLRFSSPPFRERNRRSCRKRNIKKAKSEKPPKNVKRKNHETKSKKAMSQTAKRKTKQKKQNTHLISNKKQTRNKSNKKRTNKKKNGDERIAALRKPAAYTRTNRLSFDKTKKGWHSYCPSFTAYFSRIFPRSVLGVGFLTISYLGQMICMIYSHFIISIFAFQGRSSPDLAWSSPCFRVRPE